MSQPPPQLTPYQWDIVFAVNRASTVEPLNADLMELEALGLVRCLKGRVFVTPQSRGLYRLVAQAAMFALGSQQVVVPDEGFKYALEKMFKESRKDITK